MTARQNYLEFAPPPTPGLLRGVVLAILAHGLLVAMLTVGVQWKRDAPLVTAEAELWSAIPQEAAPPAPAPELQPEPPAAEPTPPPKPALAQPALPPVVAPPSPAQPSPAQTSTAQHSIALHSTALDNTAPRSTAPHSTAQHSTVYGV